MSGKMRWDRVETQRRMIRGASTLLDSGSVAAYQGLSNRRSDSRSCASHSWVLLASELGGSRVRCERCGLSGGFMPNEDHKQAQRRKSAKKASSRKKAGKRRKGQPTGSKRSGPLPAAPLNSNFGDVDQARKVNQSIQVRRRGTNDWLWHCPSCRFFQTGFRTDEEASCDSLKHQCAPASELSGEKPTEQGNL
jgi:hypothetical protein